MARKTIGDIDVVGKRVLVRVDFNVPLDGKGTVLDDSRIRMALPTIKYLCARGAKVILASHMGRPKGVYNEKHSLKPVAGKLAELLERPVAMAGDCVGEEVKEAVSNMRGGDVLLLENVRFHPEEEKNDREFARRLAELADVYVNDAFGAAHRSHASTVGVAEFLPAVAGFLMEKELAVLEKLLHEPERPYVALIGGAKVSDKIDVLSSLLERVDALLVGGGMANTFLAAWGYKVGASAVEADKLEAAGSIVDKAAYKGLELILPLDVVVAREIKPGAEKMVVPVECIPDGWMALDIGPVTVERFSTELKKAKTVFWNGPLGVFEIEDFAQGTMAIARLLGGLGDSGVTVVVGGGDSVAAVNAAGVAEKLTHISTGGGASLEFLQGRKLPGVEVLLRK